MTAPDEEPSTVSGTIPAIALGSMLAAGVGYVLVREAHASVAHTAFDLILLAGFAWCACTLYRQEGVIDELRDEADRALKAGHDAGEMAYEVAMRLEAMDRAPKTQPLPVIDDGPATTPLDQAIDRGVQDMTRPYIEKPIGGRVFRFAVDTDPEVASRRAEMQHDGAAIATDRPRSDEHPAGVSQYRTAHAATQGEQ